MRKKRVNTFFTEKEHNKVLDEASKSGLNLPTYIRFCVLNFKGRLIS